MDLPLLTLFGAANEPVLAAKFICPAAIPQIIVERKTSHGWPGWRGKSAEMNNFHFFHFHPEGYAAETGCRN